jgi:predicted O-linked N-acetylglucosamine transferase (SPINDLY family)
MLPMNARIESSVLEQQEPALTESERLRVDIAQGKMTLIDLMRHVQNLESLGELRAASNLSAMWINHANAPDKHYALFNYGGLLQTLGRFDDAVLAYESCMALKEDFAQAYINLGLLHEKQGRHLQALNTWLKLVSRRDLQSPPAAEFLTMALNHVGRVQENLRNYAQAEEALEQSLLIQPKQPGVVQHWVHIRQKACKWPVYKPLPGITLAEMRRYTSPLAMLALTEDPAEQLATAQSFVARTYTQKQERLCPNSPYAHQRIRVGYVSGDFREHAVGFLLPSLLAGHDPARYELYAYDDTRDDGSDLRKRLQQQFQHVRPIRGLSDRQAAELILSDEIDILIDLHGLSSGARPGIFALHPAPRQGTYLGFIGPTGMPWFDFVIADRQVLPEDLSLYFTEKPVYVDGSFLPRVSYAQRGKEVSRSSLGIAEHAFVMGAFGNTYKITPKMFETWMRLLKRIPESVLWLIDDNESSTRNLKQQAELAGIAADRLLFTPRTTHDEFCARLKLADVYLDTYPYNCGSTSNDVINADVPLVSLYGKTMVSRMGLSMLTSVDAAHLATRSFADYEDKVLELSLKKQAGRLTTAFASATGFAIEPALQQMLADPYAPATPQPGSHEPALQLKLFQICYSKETRENIPAQFMALDNLSNEKPEWREYWPIRNYLMNHTLQDDAFYGFLSPRFTYKTGLDFEKIRDFTHRHGQDHDVLIFSPFWDLNSFFLNSFVQGDFFHPGLLQTAQAFSDAAGLNHKLAELVMHSDNTAYCNYFIAKKKFWLRWLELGEKLFNAAEQSNDALAQSLNQDTIYSDEKLPKKIFIQERLVNLVLAENTFKSKAWNMFTMPGSITPLNQFLPQAVSANALKLAHAQLGEPIYRDAFLQLRDQVWIASGIDKLVAARDAGLAAG